MICKDEKGSIMLETVLVLPIFVLIIFFLIQISFVWTAKQMTYYAAYCGARAALVYNPKDYHAEKQNDGSWRTNGFIRKGVVHQAACTVLSWISWSIAGNDLTQGASLAYYNGQGAELLNFWIGNYQVPLSSNIRNGQGIERLNFWVGNYQVPLSSNIRNQVTVFVKEFEKIADSSEKKEPAEIQKQFPAVTCSVRFKFPLFIPLGGPIIAYFFGANDDVCIPTHNTVEEGENTVTIDDSIGIGGFRAYNGKSVHANLVAHGNYTNVKWENEENGKKGKLEFYSIALTESCTMAKPYKTDTYPLMPETDKKFMGMVE